MIPMNPNIVYYNNGEYYSQLYYFHNNVAIALSRVEARSRPA